MFREVLDPKTFERSKLRLIRETVDDSRDGCELNRE